MLVVTTEEPNIQNIFDFRFNELDLLEQKIITTLAQFGVKFDHVEYSNEDPAAPSYIKRLYFKDGKNLINIIIPATYNFVLEGNKYAPMFQVLDKQVFRKSDGIYMSNTYMRWVITLDMGYVKVKKLKVPVLLYLIDFEEKPENVIERLETSAIKIVESKERPDTEFAVKIGSSRWMVLEYLTDSNIDALFRPFARAVNHKKFYSKINDDSVQARGLVSLFIGRARILDNLKKVALTRDYITTNANGRRFIDIIYDTYKQNVLPPLVEVNDFGKRRVRLSEWLLDDFVHQIIQKYIIKNTRAKLYDCTITRLVLKDSRKTLFTPYNPIDELATYSRCSYIGRGGIDRDSITVSMRNIHPSYYGNIDPIDTPAGKKIGVSQYIVPTANINERGEFQLNKDTDKILSITTNLIPFLQYNDSIRVQMAASQTRQAIALNEPEPPMILSGSETHYLQYTTMFIKARDNGTVLYKDDTICLIRYDNGDFEVIDTSIRESDGFDITLYLNDIDTKIKKGQILATTKHINKNGVLQLSKNLLVGFISYGWNFEDAVIISESAAKKLTSKYIHHDTQFIDGILLSLSDSEYEPVLPDGTYVEQGTPILKYANTDSRIVADLFSNTTTVKAPVNGYIYYKVRPLKTKYNYLPMLEWINKTNNIQCIRHSFLEDIIEKTDSTRDQKSRAEMLLGLLTSKRSQQNLVIDYYIISDKQVLVGSKLANRHGNKGVVSVVLPDDEMPFVPRLNKHLDLVLNPLGVISRINLGQLFELHLTNALQTYLDKIKDLPDDDYVAALLKFISTIDNTKDKININTVKNYIDKFGKDAIEDIRQHGLCIVQPPFESCTLEQLTKAMELAGIDFVEDVVVPGLYDKKKKTTIKAAIGYNYIYKLVHEPYKKIFGRAIGEYGKYEQPSSGSNAHRLGEMEVWALLAYDANNLIREFLSIKADNPDERYELFNMLYHCGDARYYKYTNLKTESSNVLIHMLQACGLKVNF